MEKSSTEKFLEDLMAQQDGTATTQQPPPQAPPAQDGQIPVAGLVIGALLLLITFLPSVVAVSNSRRFLGLLAVLFNLLAVGFSVVGIPLLTSGGGVFGFALLAPSILLASTTLWFAALICGAACCLAGIAEQRERRAHKINMRAPMAPRLR